MENIQPQKKTRDSLRSRAIKIAEERRSQNTGILNESESMLFELDVREAELELLREELGKSETEHNRLFNTLPMGIVYQDIQGKIINVNQSAAEILGFTIDQIKGRTSVDPHWQAIHEDGAAFPGDTHPSMVALNTGKTVKDVVMGVYNPVKEGITWIRINAIPLFLPGQTKPYQVYTTFDDITGQKKIEAALRESEERFRLVTEITSDYFFKLDVDEHGTVTMSYVSDNHYAATGRRLEEVKSTQAWLSIFYPEDTGRAMGLLKQLIVLGGSVELECRTYIKDGPIRWVHITAQADRDIVSGRVVSIIGAVKDINERKMAEEALRAAGERWESTFNAISELIAILDNDHRIVQCNKAMAQSLGYSREEIIGKYCYEIFHGKDVSAEICAFTLLKSDCLEHEEEIYSEILDRYFLVTVSPLFDSSGHLAGCVHAARDITGRKHDELSLIESEMRYRELFNNISSGVAIFEVKDNGADFIFKDFNRAGERLYHTRKQDVAGKSIFEARPGIGEFGILESFRRVWRTGVPEHFPESFYTDNRLSGYYENFIYRLPSGEIVAVFDNITEKKQTRIALEEETELLKLTMASIGDGVITTDINGRITMMNNKAEEITGWLQADAMNQQFSAVFRIIDEETRNEIENPVSKVMKTGKIVGLANHTVIIRRDGTERIISDTGSPIKDGKGSIHGVVIIFRDITEKEESDKALQKSEKRYRELINTLQEGVWVIDKDCYTTFVNPRMTEILGYQAEEMIGQHLFSFMDAETIELTKGYIDRRMRGIKEQHESRFIKKDGTQKLVLIETGPIFDVHGSYAGAIAGIMDITEIKQMQDMLVTREKELLNLTSRLMQVREEERNKIARDLHDNIGHMVMMIKMNLFLLEKKSDQRGKPVKDDFNEIREQIDGLIESVQRISLEIRPAVLYDLGLPEALRFFIKRFEKQTNIRCTLHVPPDIIGLQNEAAIALYRIIQEAFVNVYRHAQAAEITVDIDCTESHMTLSIRDNGRGISKEQIHHIDSLGILGMKERTIFLKGILFIEGKEGKGTLIKLTFPLVKKGEER